MFFLAWLRGREEAGTSNVRRFPCVLNTFDLYFMHASCPGQVGLSKHDLSSCFPRVIHDFFKNFSGAIYWTSLPLRWVYNCNRYHVTLSRGRFTSLCSPDVFILETKSLTSIVYIFSDILLFCTIYKSNLKTICLLSSPDYLLLYHVLLEGFIAVSAFEVRLIV